MTARRWTIASRTWRVAVIGYVVAAGFAVPAWSDDQQPDTRELNPRDQFQEPETPQSGAAPEAPARETPSAPAPEPEELLAQEHPSAISTDAFTSSQFAADFKADDYYHALQDLEALSVSYPDDPLIMRYLAITLDRLGRYSEAQAIYDLLLTREPNHVPTRFFRGQTYYRQGKFDESIAELTWVINNSPSSEYRRWSQELLRKMAPAERKRLYVFGNAGWEYDSNVILKSNDKDLAFGGDRNASRLVGNLGVGYKLIQEPHVKLDATYIARQSVHDDDLDEFNFTSQEFALNLRRRVDAGDREITLGVRYELAGGFLDGRTFELSNEIRFSADAKLTPHTRSVLYNRYTIANFGPDGSDPSLTSRDGLETDIGLTQYFYSDDLRSYLFVNEELHNDWARGDNYDRRGVTTRLGLHWPLPFIPKTDLDTSVAFLWMEYPRYASLSSLDPNERLDNNWEYYAALTYRLTPRLWTRAFYRYFNANNKNDFYQYDRHIGGTQILFTQYY